MNPTPVLYLSATAQLGGAELSLLDLVRCLDRQRFDVRIACLGDGPLVEAARAHGIMVEVLPAPRAFTRTSLRGRRTGVLRMAMGVVRALPAAYRIRRLLRATRATILHTNGNKAHLLGALAVAGLSARLVWHVRDFWGGRRFERWLVRLANRRASAVVANSEAVGLHLCRLGVKPQIVHSVPNGIDSTRFCPAGPIADLRAPNGWPATCPLVGMVGVFAPWKGQAVFLEAARLVAVTNPDARFVLVGDEIYATDGHRGLRDDLIRLTREWGLEGRIAFTGFRSDIPDILRALDVVVHASVEPEPFGRVVAEAMACGRPVVATDGGGVPAITGSDGRAAVLVPSGDASKLADGIVSLLDERAHAAALGAAARQRVVERFDLPSHVRAIEALYQELLPDQRPHVLHVGKFYAPVSGGMETVLGDLCVGTVDRWRVSALVANDRARTVRERREDVDVVRVASLGLAASVPLAPTLLWHLWRARATCVVLHEPNPMAAVAVFLCKGARLVIWHHSDIVRPWWAPMAYGPVQRALYRRAECVVVSSLRLAEHSPIVRHARRTVVIPFGIDSDRYMNARSYDAGRAIRDRYGGPLVLFVGRLVYYKGLDVLLRALTRCQAHLLLVGSGPLEDDVRRLADRLGIAERVHLEGRVSENRLVDYYAAADLFVLPSTERTEAFGLAQLEAMACGIPIVSTDLPTGVPWVNQDGLTGYVVPPGDEFRLAEAIGRLLTDAGLRRKMGEAGRRRTAELFDRGRMLADFSSLIESILSEQASV